MTRIEILKALARFEADKHKVITVKLFCEFVGIAQPDYYLVTRGKRQMTNVQQIRFERALKALAAGDVQVMEVGRGTRQRHLIIGYRKKPLPEYRRGLTFSLERGKFQLATGLVNVNDYSVESFGERFGWRFSKDTSAKNTANSTRGLKASSDAPQPSADVNPANSSAHQPSEPAHHAPPTSTAR